MLTPEQEPDHISHTQIQMYEKCGQQYYYRYCEGLKIPPGIALIQGATAHRVRDVDLKHKLETGENLVLEELEDFTSDRIDEAFAGEIVLDGEWEDRPIQAVKGAVKDQSIALARLDATEFLPKIEPLEVEKVWLVQHDLLPKPIKMIIDLVTEDGQIRDLKTCGRSPARGDADTDPQLTLYALGRRIATGEEETSVRKDYLVKTKTPKAVFQTSTRDESDLQVVLNRIARVCEGIEKELWIPAPTGAWWCSERFCGYWNQCPFAAGRKQIAVI